LAQSFVQATSDFNPRLVDDFADMLVRSRRAGVRSMIITGGSLRESKLALNLAKEHGTWPGPHLFSSRSDQNCPQIYMRLLDVTQRDRQNLRKIQLDIIKPWMNSLGRIWVALVES